MCYKGVYVYLVMGCDQKYPAINLCEHPVHCTLTVCHIHNTGSFAYFPYFLKTIYTIQKNELLTIFVRWRY